MKSIQVLFVCLLVMASSAQAESEAIYKYRSAVMSAVGGHMAAMGAILKGQVFADNLATHASALAQLAQLTPNIFPEGSDFKKSEALTEIWEKPEAFKSRVDDFVSAAEKLSQVAPSGDMRQIGGAMKNLGKSCKGCHDDFRKEHSH